MSDQGVATTELRGHVGEEGLRPMDKTGNPGMRRGVDIINAMMRPLDELHARRRAARRREVVLAAKVEFAQLLGDEGRRLEWVGSVGLLLPRPPLSRHFRVVCSACSSIQGLYARDDEDAQSVLRQCGWVLDEEVDVGWFCSLCAKSPGVVRPHLRLRPHYYGEFGSPFFSPMVASALCRIQRFPVGPGGDEEV